MSVTTLLVGVLRGVNPLMLVGEPAIHVMLAGIVHTLLLTVEINLPSKTHFVLTVVQRLCVAH
jgi:hypothetical protein